MVKQLLGEMAGVIILVSGIPYLISILKGKTKPSRGSYIIWSSVEVVWVSSYIASGATTTKYLGLAVAFSTIFFLLFSFKYGMGGFGLIDILSFIIAGLAIYFWVHTKRPEITVLMSTIAGTIGFFPLFKKIYYYPETENILSWLMYATAMLLNACALTTLDFIIALRPLINVPISLLIVAMLIFPNLRPTK